MIRHLGYACQNLTLGKKVLSSRTVRLANFTLERAADLAVKNSQDLITIINWNANNDIHFFRVGSGIFPFMDHPDVGYGIENLPEPQQTQIRWNLKQAGNLANQNNIRLSCHPGPYACLASPNDEIVNKTKNHLLMHNLLGDLLGMGEEFAINIHVGGVYDCKSNTAARFCKQYSQLPEILQNRITVENDDKSSMWSMSDLHEMLYQNCGVKLVLDIHHHRFCNRESLQQAADLAFETWAGFCEIPKIHYSESKPGSRPQAHSDYIKGPIPDLGSVCYDIMLETKAKELSLIAFRSNQVLSSSSV